MYIMVRLIIFVISLFCVADINARTLSLDSCRAMALRSNKQMSIARVNKDVAEQTRHAARTKYLPHIDVTGSYTYTSREISLLNDEQKALFANMGTAGMQQFGGMSQQMQQAFGQAMQQHLTGMVQQGQLTPAEAQKLGAFGQTL